MKHIAIYCVNYNSYEYLDRYLASIDTSAKMAKEQLHVTVIVADNSTPAQHVSYIPQSFTLKLMATGKNLGYFGAVRKAMQEVSPQHFCYSVISNVDMTLDIGFFRQLLASPSCQNVGWIAPAIISEHDGCDMNPQATTRYTLSKLRILKFLYDHPVLNELYESTLHQVKRKQSVVAGPVYAGHGSCIILTQEYFHRCGIINYPVFLYGEEIYLGENCVRNKLTTIYVPSIQVHDIGKATTGKMKRDFYYKCNAEAIAYIIRTFYHSQK